MEIDFNSLSNKSSQIINRISSFSSPIGLPSFNVERNLQEIGDTSKHLNDITSSKTPYSNQFESNVFQESKINRKYALDPKLLAKNLSNINTSSFTGIETSPTDIDGFLKIQFENIILNTIGDIQKKTSKEFQSHYEETLINDWNKDKKYLEEILGQKYIKVSPTHMGIGGNVFNGQQSMMRSTSPTNRIGMGMGQQSSQLRNSQSMIGGNINSSMINNQRGVHTSMEDRTKLSNKMKKYANIIEEFDIHMVDPGKINPYPLVNKLMDASLSSVDNSTGSTTIITHVWSLILKLTGETTTTANSSSGINGGEIKKQHKRPATNELIKRSISFLEEQFSAVILNRLPKHTNRSQPLSIIIAYIKSLGQTLITDSQDEQYDGCSIWCIIYYLIRCGYINEAQEFTIKQCGTRYQDVLIPIFNSFNTSNNNNTNNASTSSTIPTIINKEQKDRMIREFNTAKTESKDSFKISVFNLLANGDSNVTKQPVLTAIQDYIWWKLNFIKQCSLADQALQMLEALQNDIRSSLEKNRNNYESLELFQILLVTLQFEDAIASLYQSVPEDSLHLAIALDYYKLLKVVYTSNNQQQQQHQQHYQQQPTSSSSSTPIQLTLQQQEIYDIQSKSIKLYSMIKQYTKLFSFEENKEALFYYLLITDDAIKIREISELVVCSTNGFKFANELLMFTEFINKQQWRTIIEQSALELENKNDYISAIEFWLLIEEYPRVLEIYNSRISVLLTSISSERDQLYQFGKQLFNDRQGRLKTTTTARSSYLAFEQLLNLCAFFDYYNNENYQDALSKIEQLEILPIHESEIDSKVQDYRFLSPHITRNFSSIIQAYVDIIEKQYNLLADTGNGGAFNGVGNSSYTALFAGRKQSIQDLQSRTQCIALFAGKIDFPMSGNILPRLMNFLLFSTSSRK